MRDSGKGKHAVPNAHLVAAEFGTILFERFKLSFPLIPDPSLTYTAEGTGNLADWDDIWTSPGAPDLAGPVTVADSETIVTQARRMLRLKVARD